MSDVGEHAVFQALASEVRRGLMETLQRNPGSSLTELSDSQRLVRQALTRHLDILAEAGLVVTRRVGRRKLHYLNPVPLEEVYEGWMRRFISPSAEHLVRVRTRLGSETRDEEPSGRERADAG